MDINKVTLIGRLIRKPELRETPSGQSFAALTVATSYMWRDYKTKEKKDKTEFHRLVAFGKLTDVVLEYLDKGSRIYVEGRLQHREWQDFSGQKRNTTDIVVDEIIVLGKKKAA